MEMIFYVIGLIVACAFTNWVCKRKQSLGTLIIDQSSPDKDIYRFEIENLDALKNRKEVVLKIKTQK